MKLKYRFETMKRFFAFAFYPKITLIVCGVFSAILIAVLGLVMRALPHDSVWYSITFALTTGAAGSFFVTFIVELASNYRHSMLAWNELQDYYSTIFHYELHKQVLMQRTASQRAEQKAYEEYIAAGGADDRDEEDRPKDIIQTTWELLPEFIPTVTKTLEEKKAFLNGTEIRELSDVLSQYHQIHDEIHMRLMFSPILHNVVNHPDEKILNTKYPKNIREDMPDWLRKRIASRESEDALKQLVDIILSDRSILTQFMENYDISENGLKNYSEQCIDENDRQDDFEVDDAYDFVESETEEAFRVHNAEYNRQIEEENRPFVSWHISRCCAEIAKSMEILEQCVRKKPYYGLWLEANQKASDVLLDDHLPKHT